jgi:hypothetical protein
VLRTGFVAKIFDKCASIRKRGAAKVGNPHPTSGRAELTPPVGAPLLRSAPSSASSLFPAGNFISNIQCAKMTARKKPAVRSGLLGVTPEFV